MRDNRNNVPTSQEEIGIKVRLIIRYENPLFWLIDFECGRHDSAVCSRPDGIMRSRFSMIFDVATWSSAIRPGQYQTAMTSTESEMSLRTTANGALGRVFQLCVKRARQSRFVAKIQPIRRNSEFTFQFKNIVWRDKGFALFPFGICVLVHPNLFGECPLGVDLLALTKQPEPFSYRFSKRIALLWHVGSIVRSMG